MQTDAVKAIKEEVVEKKESSKINDQQDEDDAAASTAEPTKRSPLLKTVATSEPNSGLSQL